MVQLSTLALRILPCKVDLRQRDLILGAGDRARRWRRQKPFSSDTATEAGLRGGSPSQGFFWFVLQLRAVAESKEEEGAERGAHGTPKREGSLQQGDGPLLIEGLSEQLLEGEYKWSPGRVQSWEADAGRCAVKSSTKTSSEKEPGHGLRNGDPAGPQSRLRSSGYCSVPASLQMARRR